MLAVAIIVIPTLGHSASPDAHAERDLASAPRAVSLALRLLGRDASERAIHDAFAGRVTGTHSYDDVTDAVRNLGFETCSARLDSASPRLPRVPLIAAVRRSPASGKRDHLVVLYGSGRGLVQLLDFPHPPRLVPCEVLAEQWDGRGVYVAARRGDLPSSVDDSRWVCGLLVGGAAMVGAASLALWFLARKGPRRQGEVSGHSVAGDEP
jgi:hypothetical protein